MHLFSQESRDSSPPGLLSPEIEKGVPKGHAQFTTNLEQELRGMLKEGHGHHCQEHMQDPLNLRLVLHCGRFMD
jgi:hypothetical protein